MRRLQPAGGRVVVAGAEFATLDTEKRILASIGAEVVDARRLPVEETRQLCRTADAIMTDYFRCDADLIAELERCRVICQYGIGVDQIDVDAASKHGIPVTNTPGFCVDELAEHTFALLLSVVRKIPRYDAEVRANRWDFNSGRPIRRLRGQVLGLIGFGHAGRAVAARALAFGLRVLAYDAYVPEETIRKAAVEPADFGRVLADADIVSIHAPLTEETRGLLGAAELGSMRKGSILINTARGGIVDEDALVRALRDGSLAGAGLDVLEREPPPTGHPLLELENVVLTPHAAFLSEQSLLAVQEQAADEVRRVLSNERPKNLVNPETMSEVASWPRSSSSD